MTPPDHERGLVWPEPLPDRLYVSDYAGNYEQEPRRAQGGTAYVQRCTTRRQHPARLRLQLNGPPKQNPPSVWSHPHQENPELLFVQQVVKSKAWPCFHWKSTQPGSAYWDTSFRNPGKDDLHRLVSSLPTFSMKSIMPTLRNESIRFNNLIHRSEVPAAQRSPGQTQSRHHLTDRKRYTPTPWA